MATIRRQKSNNRWQAVIRRQGVKESRTFRTRDQAATWAREVEDAIDGGTYTERRAARTTLLEEIIDLYRDRHLPRRSGHSHSTQLNLISAALGHFPVAAISPRMVADFRDARLREVSESTTRKDLMKLSALLQLAQKEGLELPRGNPIKLIDLPEEPPHRDRRLERGEYRKLLRAAYAGRRPKRADGGTAYPLYALIMRWAIETGMRQGEIAALRWKDVNLKSCTAKVVNEDPRRRRKQAAAGNTNDGPRRRTKTDQSRIVPLSPAAVQVLHRVKRDYPGSGRVFKYKTGGGISQAHERVAKRASLHEEDLLFHDFRHEAASRLAQKLAAHELSYMLGHSDISTTMRYYHPRPEDILYKLRTRP